MFSREQFAKMMESSLLKPAATRDDVLRYCEEAKQYHFATVVTLPFWVPLVARQLADSDVKPATVIGFPFGANGRTVKIFEARTALTNGAKELDFVINISAVKSGEFAVVEREINELMEAVRVSGMTQDARRTLVKIILETAYLNDAEKTRVCQIARAAAVDFIKTSTGTAPTGATVEDIRLIRTIVGPDIGVKAAGGIRTAEHAVAMIDAGANRLGTSNAAQIVDSYLPEDFSESAERRR